MVLSYSDKFNRKAQFDHLMLSMSGLTEAAGLQRLNNASGETIHHAQQKNRNSMSLYDIIQLLTEAKYRLDNFIYDMDMKLIQAHADLEHYREQLAERIALQGCLDALANGNMLERDENGHLKDQHLRKVIERYTAKNNIDLQLLNNDAYIQAIAQKLIDTYQTQAQLNQIIVLQQQKIITIRSGKEKAEDMQSDLTNAEHLPPETIKQKVDGANEQIGNTYSEISNWDKKISALKTVPDANITPHENTTSHSSSELEMFDAEDMSTVNAPLPKSNMTF